MVTLILAAPMASVGCGEGSTASPPAALEIEGAWVYLGPSDGPHDLTISRASMVYADVDGNWSSTWTIKSYDNGLHHFQVVFASGSGTYLPVGASLSGTYDVGGSILTVQLASGLTSYPNLQNAGTCTDATSGTATPECRVYVKQN
jgi:hypothetical protein